MTGSGTGVPDAPTSTPDRSSALTVLQPPELAGIGRRLASLLYEGLLLLAVLFLGSALFTAVAGTADSLATRSALQAVLVALAAAYFLSCWTRGGQTLPMQAWQLRIVDVSTGQPPVLKQALTRYLAAIPGILLGGASFVWALFDRDRQFLHDRLAGTHIIRVRRSGTRLTPLGPPDHRRRNHAEEQSR